MGSRGRLIVAGVCALLLSAGGVAGCGGGTVPAAGTAPCKKDELIINAAAKDGGPTTFYVTVRFTVYCGDLPATAKATVTWADGTTSSGTTAAGAGTGKLIKGFVAAQAGGTLKVTVMAQDGPVTVTVPIS